ncbi:FAD/NAD(P)-binding oxidoreductase family protein [Striga asiatica]|uniref:FAD/NAD(P)-binding oxidoreductase family protein n=1 Tax=Striga asiatica TaxID=4170 RepID=A0A5A7R2M7_STRAF|nr:FAD/NAD(P)-binding oxidoreductase family protein [Striga asiatica]
MNEVMCFLNDDIVVREYLYLKRFAAVKTVQTFGFARIAVNPPFRLEPSDRPPETLATGVGLGLDPPSASGDIDSPSEPHEEEAVVSFKSEAGGERAASCVDAVPIGVFEVLGGDEGLGLLGGGPSRG